MEPKKSSNANLEKGKSLYLLIGFVAVLGFLYVAFEWTKSEVIRWEIKDKQGVIEEDWQVPITERPKDVPPPKPPLPDILVIVPDKTAVESVNPVSSEDTQQDAQPIIIPPIAGKDEPDDDTPLIIAEKEPEFPGGKEALRKYLIQAIRYPAIAIELNIEGKVTCQFVVNRDGSISEIEVLRGVDVSLDKEAIRVIKAMPKWIPGEQRGRAVRVRLSLPVNFKLQKY